MSRALAILALLLPIASAPCATINVSPDGPISSLAAARDAIRKLQPLAEPVRVIIADGEYALTEPVIFGPGDSGTPEFPISYEAAPGAKPVFTGGKRITGFTEGEAGIWTAKVPGVAAGDWYFEQLWVNGKRAVRARTPNKHYIYTRGKVGAAVDPKTGEQADLTGRAFRALPEDIAGVPETTDTTLVVYHSWEAARMRVESIDTEQNMVVTTAGTPWGFERWGPSQRYHIENYLAGLDAPGEWFLSRDGTLSYMPREGEDMTSTEVIAPAGPEQFVLFQGEPEIGWTVENITLKRLTFSHGQYILPPEGHADGQAEDTVPAVIMADGARNIAIEDCEISHHGLYTIWFRRGCQNCSVTKTLLYDMGAGGVRIGEGVIQPDLANRTGSITVDNNIIHSGARIHLGAHGVWIGHSPYNKVTHNDISDFYYTLISVGWRWGYAESLAHDNTIDFNHLHHTGWGVLSDMGAVYTLGPSPNTTVSNNHCHHIYSYNRYGRGGWGFYNDEGSSYITMENNLVHHVGTGTYHQHYGRENMIRNNILAYSLDGQLQRSRIEEHLSFTYEGNIVLWDDGPFKTAGSIKDDLVQLKRNMYWKESGPDIDFDGMTLAERQEKGWDEGSVIADPMFVDPANGDFRFKPDAPYEKIGFTPFDYTEAGVYGDETWVNLPKSFVFADVEHAPDAPPPPPFTFTNDFEVAAIGSGPADARVYTENKGDSIAVTDETAASGAHSLKITDAPDLEHEYNPHFFWSPNHKEGVVTFAFDIRADEGVVMYHEWRDNSAPYQTGPSFWISGGMLRIGGQDVLPMPTGEWVHFEVSAPLGEKSTGTWDLTVTPADGEATKFESQPNVSADWKTLTWLGFSSTATDTRAYYLDNLDLSINP
ncbi:MAG TPA: right-handed parallel beta-helix repeat-containing protein [Armatimonadota bacterium]|nr:right-handed parallel beta-helix repeat-containing protein [Armatimonadota bacterium]